MGKSDSHPRENPDVIVVSSCAEVANPCRGQCTEINRIANKMARRSVLTSLGNPSLSKQVSGMRMSNGNPVVLEDLPLLVP
jgi:hypothetical protein